MEGHPDIDLAHIHWSSPELIYALPSKSLSTPDEALDYFAQSPFFDVRSNNQALRVQRVVTGMPYGHAQEKLDLLNFRTGFEFVVAHTHPPDLFVIHRRDVGTDGTRTTVTGAWFILEGKIYPSPNVYDVMATRLRNASFLVSSTFATLSAAHPPSNPRTHSAWRSLPPSAQEDKPQSQSTTDAGEVAQPTAPDSTLPNFALLHALQSTRAAIPDLDELAQSPAPTIDPAEELARIERDVMGAGTAALDPARAGASNPARSVRSVSVVPTLKDRERSLAGTPGARLFSARTPGLPGTSPLATQL
ncbi:MED6 mediator sub complex component-domain-containing protein [Papiliotrema laurentii]|uniref:Mediator of RNA polymerase II transcription subunit 6 n=1 Tax=Papiliotrema laurentii TaxID=5418 RepID=A0AAD9FPU8_PAPLA|nr:MED6 mediator sub complex component-domain-containing protein [Papiliotrema laurentii]